MFMATSVRRAPSTFTSRSIAWRNRATSASVRSLTRVSGFTAVTSSTLDAVVVPTPKM